jgi:hypothetical protein
LVFDKIFKYINQICFIILIDSLTISNSLRRVFFLSTNISYNPTFSLQSPIVAISSTPQPKPSSWTNSQIQSFIQQSERPFYETQNHVQEPRPASYQMPQSNPQIDWIILILHQETSKHNEIRLALQSSRRVNQQLEQLLYQEQTFNYTLQVNIQEAEKRRINTKDKLRAYEQ